MSVSRECGPNFLNHRSTQMDTDFECTAETRRRQGTLAQTEVVDEIGLFPEVGFAREYLNDDLTYAGRNLVARPTRSRGSREIGLVSHDPAGQFADGLGLDVELGALSLGKLRTNPCSGSRHDRNDGQAKRDIAGRENQDRQQAREQRSDSQQRRDPVGSDEGRVVGDSQIIDDSTKKRPPRRPGEQCSKHGRGRNRCPRDSARGLEGLPQKIKRTVSQARFGGRHRHLAEHEVNELSRRQDFRRLGIFDANVEGFLDRHHDFYRVHSHTAIVPVLAATSTPNT